MSLYQDNDFDVEIELEDSEWPKEVRTFVHGSKEYGAALGEEIGLSDEAIRENFMWLHYEVELTILVYEDGNYVITHVDGHPVGEQE